MPRGIRRFEGRLRPVKNTEKTDVFPVIKDPIKDDEAVTGEIPVPAAPAEPADAEVTGEIPAVPDDKPDHDDDVDEVADDIESPDFEAERPTVLADRLEQVREHAARIGTYLWHRLVYLTAIVVAWLIRETRIRVPQAARWLRPRLTRLSASVVAGLLLCASYPQFNWWWAAILAFGALAWVLTRPATTPIGGFGYGFLFGLAFYLPLIRWISILVGAVPLLALVALCAAFPGLFGLAAVTVRRLPGWPVWFALLWTAQ
jgi:apolipoprotein N-acyltransferase